MSAAMFSGGRRSISAAAAATTPPAAPTPTNTGPRPNSGTRFTESVPRISDPRPNPIMSTPDENPTLSGNHRFVVDTMVLYPMPTPKPPSVP